MTIPNDQGVDTTQPTFENTPLNHTVLPSYTDIEASASQLPYGTHHPAIDHYHHDQESYHHDHDHHHHHHHHDHDHRDHDHDHHQYHTHHQYLHFPSVIIPLPPPSATMFRSQDTEYHSGQSNAAEERTVIKIIVYIFFICLFSLLLFLVVFLKRTRFPNPGRYIDLDSNA